jgi:protein-S-isoprenylcysteine O-methyltransferase Ste14
MKKIKLYIRENWQFLFDIYLFLNFLAWCGWQAYKTIAEGRLDFVEGSFIVHNAVLVTVIIIRMPHKALDKNIFNQFIALTAFFSGAAFMGQPETKDSILILFSQFFLVISNFFGIITLLNLGKSFGILIAFRKIKSNGLYSFVRHPMYGTDILLRIGYIISHFNLFTIIAFIISTSCYIYRAFLEEKFLSKQSEDTRIKLDMNISLAPQSSLEDLVLSKHKCVVQSEYKEYMCKVKYRFIPFIF